MVVSPLFTVTLSLSTEMPSAFALISIPVPAVSDVTVTVPALYCIVPTAALIGSALPLATIDNAIMPDKTFLVALFIVLSPLSL